MGAFNSAKLLNELQAAGVPVTGCDGDGNVYFKPTATQADRDTAAQVLAAHNPAPTAIQALDAAVANQLPLETVAALLVAVDGILNGTAVPAAAKNLIGAAAAKIKAAYGG